MSTKNIENEIKKAKNGSQSAFSFLLDTYWNYVYGFQLKKNLNEEDAEDITIQTFSKAFEKINTFDEKYEFKTWLITISKRIFIDIQRKKKIDTSELQENVKSIADENPSPEEQIILEQNLAKLLKDIKKLKPKYQEVINLRFFQELSYKEIAEQINEPVNNVKVKLLRAKKLLAEIIKDI